MREIVRPLIEDTGTAPAREHLLRDDNGRRVLKAWLAIRLTVGLLGLLMPVLLIVGDVLVLAGGPATRGSLSAYYHSGVRDVFVGTLCVIGLFLITYQINERSIDNRLTLVAGAAAIGVALFPTWTDRGQPLTPLQERLDEQLSATIHLTAAALFTLALAIMSLRFAHRDGRRGHARFASVHRVCGVLMLLAVGALVGLKIVGVDQAGGYTVLLIVELVCTVAFGISWILKGVELRRAIHDAESRPVAGPGTPSAGRPDRGHRAEAAMDISVG